MEDKKTGTFPLVGLSKPHSFTLYNKPDGDIFWSSSTVIDRERFAALFNWADTTDDFWSGHSWMAEVEYDRLSEDGTPINPNVLNVFENGR